jgi:dihydroorotate dehydrogenase electron transfer subunit
MVGTDLYERCGASPIVAVNDADRTSDIALLRDPVNEIIERQKVEQIFVCGSSRLLELAVESALAAGASVQVSLEAHMACGLGYCHGCSSGHPGLALEAPLVCSTGPVFMAGA